MPRLIHIAQSIDGLLANHPLDTWPDLFLNDDGTRPTLDECKMAVGEAMAKGYDVIPPCQNIDHRGRCVGHESDLD